MSVLKHSVLLLALWTGIIAYYMYHPLPDDLEEPWKVRLLLAGLKFTGHIAFASSKLGIATEHETMRWILNTAYVAGMKIDDPDLNIKTTEIEGVRVRIYEPVKGSAYGPAIVYFHGGGWTIMSIDTHDEFTRELARRTQFTVISVDYRLAPEHPFPAPFDDCFAVTRHLLEFGSQFKIDPSKIVVMAIVRLDTPDNLDRLNPYLDLCEIAGHQVQQDCFTAINCPTECKEKDGTKHDVGSSWQRSSDGAVSRCYCTRDIQLKYTWLHEIYPLPEVPLPAFAHCKLLGCRGHKGEFLEPFETYITDSGTKCRCIEGSDPSLRDAPATLYYLSCDPDHQEPSGAK
ncbi:neutral cholesterol ester hydrolase 1-like isoform X3 [Tubulanus polymorphus]|uniref:neutral cholesterol ester hydrolase 1-like isoform X3 n=1 Tax=Tubulanus polymorphus TaxID=672921 RepID=UPI003DA6CBB3